jgi:hypothetical protein
LKGRGGFIAKLTDLIQVGVNVSKGTSYGIPSCTRTVETRLKNMKIPPMVVEYFCLRESRSEVIS